MQSTSFYQLGNGAWKPDVSIVRLICSGIVIGECYLDLTNYIGKQQLGVKAVMQRTDASLGKHLALVGDPIKYPGACIEFKVTVVPSNAPVQ